MQYRAPRHHLQESSLLESQKPKGWIWSLREDLMDRQMSHWDTTWKVK